MKFNRFATLFAALGLAAFSPSSFSQNTNAVDSASNYSGGWNNGANGGTGFGAWEFESNNNNTDKFAGAYLAASNNPAGRNLGIFSPDASGNAFILYAHPAGTFMNAKRNFGGSNAVPLAVGESFNFSWVQFWANGDKGINLYRSGWDDGNDRAISLRQSDDNFVAQPRGSSVSPVAISNAFNNVTMVKLRRAAPDTLVLTVQTDDAADGSYTNTFRAPAPDRVKFYYANGPAGIDENNPRPLFNNLSITTDPIAVATRQAKFSVNMGFLEGQTPKKFDPASGDKVFVRGYPSGGWGDGEKVELIQEPGTSVYSKAIAVAGDTGLKSGGYKFFIEKGVSSTTVVDNGGYETSSEREFDLPASDTNLTVVFFNNISATRNVTYAVDMGVQIFKGLFNPATNGVEVRGDFNGFNGSPLVRDGTSTVYTNTFTVPGAEGSTNEFKFFTTGTNAVGYEGGENRKAVLTANAVPLNTGTNFFGGLAESRKITFRVDMSVQQQLGNFNTNAGVVNLAGSFNSWTQTALIPQGNGIYAGEFTVDGPLSAVEYKFYNGSTAEPDILNRTITDSLLNLTPSQLAVVYFNNIATAGSSFAGWAGSGTATNSELVGKYGIGGATNISAASEKPVAAVGSNTLSLSAIVRTNDTKLTVVGEAGGSLTNWSTNGVSMTPSDNTSGVPNGHQRQVFSVDRTNSPTRQFLRLKATLAP